MKTKHNTPFAAPPRVKRQPLLWAALAFSAGIIFSTYFWRPPVWWLIAGTAFAAVGAYFLKRRVWAASCLSFCVLFAAGAFNIQVRPYNLASDPGIQQFTGGNEVLVTAHVVREGDSRPAGFGGSRQILDVETEQIGDSAMALPIRTGLRVSFYSKAAENEDEVDTQATVRALQYGTRLRFAARLFAPHNFRNPGAFDYRGYLAENGIAALASAKADSVQVLPGFVGSRMERWRARVHRRIIENIHALWPSRQAGLIDAMVIGEDAFLQPETRTEFQRSGTYHVLVVSGMNVGILAFAIFWVLRRFRVGDLAASLATVVLVVAYAFLTDVGAPVWRATLMLVLYLGTRFLHRERCMLNAIGAAAFGLLVIDPKALLSASFQMTFLCVLLIAGAGVPFLERTSQPFLRGMRNLAAVSYDWSLPPRVAQFRLDIRAVAHRLEPLLGKRIALPTIGLVVRTVLAGFELLFISAVMQIGLALPMAYYFHRATVVGLPANLLVVPLTGIMMPLAVLGIALSFISFLLAKAPALLAGLALQAITESVRGLGAYRVANTRVATPEILTILAGVIAIALALLLARRRPLIAGIGLAALAASAFWITVIPPHPQLRAGMLELTAIDVGQGDALLVVSPEGRTLLVDAGGTPHWMQSGFDIGEDVVSPYLWSRGIHHLDAVAVTHAHADHMGGMNAVLANFQPSQLWLGADSLSPDFQNLLLQARNAGVAIVHLGAGESFDFGKTTIRILAPAFDPQSHAWRRNDDSLAMKVSFGNTSLLLEGDAERQTEQRIAKEQPQANLLKVAHHGSATSTLPELLAAVKPQYAVISVGARNNYGHPRAEVLNRLENARVATYRTDLNGAVTFYLDGRSVSPELASLR